MSWAYAATGILVFWHIGPWSDCDCQSGGPGQRSRTVLCQQLDGATSTACPEPAPAEAEECSCFRDAQTFTGPCTSLQYSWRWSEWSPCSDVCGGTQDRQVICSRQDGQQVDDHACSAWRKPETSHACGPEPCGGNVVDTVDKSAEYRWKLGEWSQCEEGCGGLQWRTVTCVQITDMVTTPSGCYGDGHDGGDGGYGCDSIAPAPADSDDPSSDQVKYEQVDEELCGGSTYRPPHWHRCAGSEVCERPEDINPGCHEPNDFELKFCKNNDDCHRNGVCKHGFCKCAAGFYGLHCEWGCPQGSEQVCDCCTSAVFDASGNCCDDVSDHYLVWRPTVDKDGECCYEGWIDACGVCGGDGVAVDKYGACCTHHEELDGFWSCCSDGVDHCGVCGGDSSSCAALLTLTLSIIADDHSDLMSQDSFVIGAVQRLLAEVVPDTYDMDEMWLEGSKLLRDDPAMYEVTVYMPAGLSTTAPGGWHLTLWSLPGLLYLYKPLSVTYDDVDITLSKTKTHGVCGDGLCSPDEVNHEVESRNFWHFYSDSPSEAPGITPMLAPGEAPTPSTPSQGPLGFPWTDEPASARAPDTPAPAPTWSQHRRGHGFEPFTCDIDCPEILQCIPPGWTPPEWGLEHWGFFHHHPHYNMEHGAPQPAGEVTPAAAPHPGWGLLDSPARAPGPGWDIAPAAPGPAPWAFGWGPTPAGGMAPMEWSPHSHTRELPEGAVHMNVLYCSGAGLCDLTGYGCQCFDGYAGKYCEMCDIGFRRGSNNLCQPVDNMCKAPPLWSPPFGITYPPNTPMDTPPGLEPPAATSPPDQEIMVPPPGEPSTDATYYKIVTFGDTPCERDGTPVTCGGGIQQATVTCYNSDNQQVALDQCSEITDEERQQTCNNVPCTTYSWQAGDLEAAPCIGDCGDEHGYKYVRVVCVSSTGLNVDAEFCDQAQRPRAYQLCTPPPCSGPHYKYSTWSSCSKTCGGGTQTRTATCHSQDGTAQNDNTLCEDSGIQMEEIERSCNTGKCAVFGWIVLPWSDCENADEGCGGVRTCELQCKNLFAQVAAAIVNNAQCPADVVPPTEQDCRPCEDFCSQYGALCGVNGAQCFSDECICPDGWGGMFCDVDLSQCSSGVTDKYDACCESGVVNKRGECCTEGTPISDWQGECCAAGFVDGCGVCGGNGFARDFEGTCCQEGDEMTNQYYCCKAPYKMDECGVCGGTGDTCGTVITFTITVSISDGRKLLDSIGAEDTAAAVKTIVVHELSYPEAAVDCTAEPTEAGFDMTVELAALEVEEQASSAAVVDKSSVGGRIFVGMESSDQFSGRTSPPTVGILTTCGDATCHLGEEVTVDPNTGEEQGCAPDCPIMLGNCGAPGSSEVGNPEAECGGFGYCNRAAQVCVCAEGYGGDACEYCTDGYLRAPGRGVDYEVCEINVSALKSSGQTAPPPPQTAGRGLSPEAPGGDSNGGGSHAGKIAGATIGAVAAVAVIAGLAWAFKTGRIGRRRGSQQYLAEDTAV